MSPEDVCNIALRRIGWTVPIGNIYEGSPAARAAVEFYVHERDELTVSEDWQFARQEVSLGLPIKTAPVGGYAVTPWSAAYPLLPWIYEYPYPADCLKIRSVRGSPALIPVFDPVPNIFTIANDPSLSPSRVVLTNLLTPIACVTAPIADPTLWSPEPRFTEALVQRLALRFQEALAPKPDEVKERMIEEMPDPIVETRG